MPTCFFNRTYLGYEIVETSNVNFIQKSKMQRTNKQVKQPYLGGIDELTLTLEYLGENIIHVKVNNFLNQIIDAN